MDKFGRNYRLTIQMNDGSKVLIVEPPLTLQFSVLRSTMASLNTGRFEIFNLTPETRNQIFQDRFNNPLYRKVTLEGGYGKTLSTIFVGAIFEANSHRQRADVITTIDARDGGFDIPQTQTFRTVQQGTPMLDVIKGLIGDFPNLKQGAIGDIPGTLQRPAVLDGNTYTLINKYTGNLVNVDLEKVNVLTDKEVLSGVVPLIDPSTGLLDTPRRDDAYLTIRTLFEPRIVMNQAVQLQSVTLPQYNGQYKVIGVQHQGTISEAVCGECTSTFNLLLGAKIFGALKTV